MPTAGGLLGGEACSAGPTRYDRRMRTLATALFLLGACGGPSQQQIIETPAATAPYRHTEAPPASVSDEDRHHLVQQFDDMETTQQAYGQAEAESPAPPPPSTPATGATAEEKRAGRVGTAGSQAAPQ